MNEDSTQHPPRKTRGFSLARLVRERRHGPEDPIKPPARKTRRFSLAQLTAERRRAVISFSAGLIVLLLIQIPAVEQSFLGAPDRQMMDTAFKLRADLIRGTADPILFIDIDDRTISQLGTKPGSFDLPPATTPRALMADLLEFIRTAPPAQAPRVVILDVDIAQPAPDGPDAIAQLQKELAAWATTPSAPPLIISRQPYPGAALGMDTPAQVLPTSPYDATVQAAPNIYWATPRVLGDQFGVIREFAPYDCVLTSTGMKPLYSAALIAYQFIERDPKVLDQAAAKHWMAEGAAQCQNQTAPQLRHGERIDYHFSLDLGFANRAWPSLDKGWPGAKACSDSDSAVVMRLSAIDISSAFKAGGDVSRDILCQHVVIIGGTNTSGGDFVQTPLNEMNGSAVLANAVRGLQLTHGGLRPIPLIIQILLLAAASMAMSASALASNRARTRTRQLRRSHEKHKLRHRLEIIFLNPVILNGIIALTAHGVGIVLLLVSLNFGLWGFVSAPVFAAAITETVQEFADG
ncbi:MAG TPA: CHASE2 domain-containing protein [Caulobacteraceae bacterium]